MSANLLKDRTAIVGIGSTSFGKGFAESEEQLACQVIKQALDEAGISPGEVDALSGDPDRRCGDVEGGFGEAAAERQRQQEYENEGGAHGGSFRSRAMRRAG